MKNDIIGEAILDKFLERFFFLKEEGWEETSEPFKMIHKLYGGPWSLEEAYEIETKKNNMS